MEIGIPRFHQISKTCKLYELHKIMSLDGDTQGQVLMYIEKQGKEWQKSCYFILQTKTSWIEMDKRVHRENFEFNYFLHKYVHALDISHRVKNRPNSE